MRTLSQTMSSKNDLNKSKKKQQEYRKLAPRVGLISLRLIQMLRMAFINSQRFQRAKKLERRILS